MTSTTPVGSGERVLSPVSSRNRPSLRDAGPLPGPPGVPSHAWEIGRPWSRLHGHEAEGVSAPPWPLSQHVMAAPVLKNPAPDVVGPPPPKEQFREKRRDARASRRLGPAAGPLKSAGPRLIHRPGKRGPQKGE